MKTRSAESQYVICVRNRNCEDLELRKVYKVLPDKTAAKDGYIGIVDESGEDYLYPEDYFLPIDLPRPVERALALES